MLKGGEKMINLKIARIKKGLKQEEVGELIGVSSVTVSRWELGLNNIPSDKLILLSKVLDVSTDYLLGLE